MSADNYLLCRPYKEGWLVTMEFLSDDEPSNADKAYERAMSKDSNACDGFFDLIEQAEAFIDYLYDGFDNGEWNFYFEYGPTFMTKEGVQGRRSTH